MDAKKKQVFDEAERKILVEQALAYSEEEAKAIVSALPTYILWEEVGNRISDLLDFRNCFEELSNKTKKIPF